MFLQGRSALIKYSGVGQWPPDCIINKNSDDLIFTITNLLICGFVVNIRWFCVLCGSYLHNPGNDFILLLF